MLVKFRNLSNNLLVKALLLALVLSLVIWEVKLGTDNKNYVAVVGKKNYIYREDFVRAKKNFLHTMRQAYGKQSLDDANINQIILNSLLQNELLKLEGESLGLLIKDAVVFEEIKTMPVFKNKAGKFDKGIFRNALAANGIKESEFVDNIRSDIVMHILNSMFTTYSPSEDLIKEFSHYSDQKRVINLVTIRPSQGLAVPAVQDKDLELYYAANKERFAVPEARDVEYITITPELFKGKVKLSDEEIKEALANAKNDKPVVERIKANLLTTKIYKALHEEIKVIEDEIAAGSNLKEIAKKHNLHYASLEKLTHSGQGPKLEQFVEQAFAAAEDMPSDAITIQKDTIAAGYYILSVPKIYKSHYKPLEEIKPQLAEYVKEEQKMKAAEQEALSIYNRIVAEKKPLDKVVLENSNISLKEITVGRSAEKGSNVSADLLADVFSLKDKSSYTNLYRSPEIYAFQFATVKEIKLPQAVPSERTKAVTGQLSHYLTDAIKQEFLDYLHSKYPVKVFQATIKEL
jgi:peptidyl-prolyl cis-trans isomerase D